MLWSSNFDTGTLYIIYLELEIDFLTETTERAVFLFLAEASLHWPFVHYMSMHTVNFIGTVYLFM